jgi:hypothetical protein
MRYSLASPLSPPVWTKSKAKAGKKEGQYKAGQQVGLLPDGCEVIVGESAAIGGKF